MSLSKLQVLAFYRVSRDYDDGYEFSGDARITYIKDGERKFATLAVCLDFGGEWMYCTREYGEAISAVPEYLVPYLKRAYKQLLNPPKKGERRIGIWKVQK